MKDQVTTSARQIANKKTTLSRWTISSRIFHWVSVVLLIIIWSMFVVHEQTDSSSYMNLHKAFGVMMLFWTLARIINRFFTTTPPMLPMPKWQTALAHATHFCLYLLLLAMPLAGILMTMYGGRTIDIFGMFTIHPFVDMNRDRARFFNDLHTSIIWSSILLLTLLHIVGALYHQFIRKDNAIKRML